MTSGRGIKPVALKVPTMQALMEQAIEDFDGNFFLHHTVVQKEKKSKLHFPLFSKLRFLKQCLSHSWLPLVSHSP